MGRRAIPQQKTTIIMINTVYSHFIKIYRMHLTHIKYILHVKYMEMYILDLSIDLGKTTALLITNRGHEKRKM